MITFTRLGSHGQLGNQMFQYSVLLGVAARNNYQVKIPQTLVRRKKHGLFELDKFNISSSRLNILDRKQIINNFHEKGFDFDPTVLEQPDGTNFDGYYQTEKYFTHIEDQIRKEFTFIHPIDRYAQLFMERNRTEGSAVVAVHVRRGDYLDNPDRFHVLTPEYYQQAMIAMEKITTKRVQWFVFSDDLEWCRSNISNEFTTFVESASHWHDLAIMTYCDAYIISASSYSWWGAYLSHAQNQTVLAPYPWFPTGPRENYNMNDIIPERWTKLDALTGLQL